MNKFQCDNCGKIEKQIGTEEDTIKEMLELWGNIPSEERAIVCDNCFAEFMEWWEREGKLQEIGGIK